MEISDPRQNRVAIIEAQENIEEAMERAVRLIGGINLSETQNVIIKPNVCNAKNPDSMVITDFRIIETMIRLIQHKTNKITVVESDNISDTAENRMEASGLMKLLKKLDVDFLNLSEDRYEIHEVAGKKLKLPRTVLEADYFVNLPKIKTEGHVSVTLSIKNLFGLLQRKKKSSLHGKLNEILPYLVGTIKHNLILVDGLTCMEGNGPLIGTPKPLGIVVAGVNPVSVDSVCSNIMGFDPSSIHHINRAYEMGLGNMDLNSIETLGDGLEKFICEFEKPYTLRASLKSLRSIRKVYLTK